METKLLDKKDGTVVIHPGAIPHRHGPYALLPDYLPLTAHRYRRYALADFIESEHFRKITASSRVICISVHMIKNGWPTRLLKQQAAVLKAAIRSAIPVYFVFVNRPDFNWSINEIKAELPDRLAEALNGVSEPSRSEIHAFFVGTSSALESRRSDSNTKLSEVLATRRINYAVVFGQDRDVCVASTIFGGPEPQQQAQKMWGLLDSNIRVITSIDVLHGGQNISPYYTFSMEDHPLKEGEGPIGAGLAVKSAVASARQSATDKPATRWAKLWR